jgi:hypothetical protein
VRVGSCSGISRSLINQRRVIIAAAGLVDAPGHRPHAKAILRSRPEKLRTGRAVQPRGTLTIYANGQYSYAQTGPIPKGGGQDVFGYEIVDGQATKAQSLLTVTVSPAATLATVPQLADYLVNGFWQWAGGTAHHWATNVITYNLGDLNSAEQTLALSALSAWHDVANVTFVQTNSAPDILFADDGSGLVAVTSPRYTSGIMSSAVVDISSQWITSDGGSNDGRTGIYSYGYQTYIHVIGKSDHFLL